MKRIVTIQDISCVGKCSVTVALPIISAMGVETAVIPTAVLSTHTMFQGYTFCDLTEEINKISQHWKKEEFSFDAIYTGYLGSFDQLALVGEFFEDFKTKDNVIFVDPVMADNGSLYPGFTPEFAAQMARLCSKADIIVPNMTEACFMLGLEYTPAPYRQEFLEDILKRFADMGVKLPCLTGVALREGTTGVMSYNPKSDEFFTYTHELIPAGYHGTGDIFASCCVGALMNGFDIRQALKMAAQFTSQCIKVTYDSGKVQWYGVDFELVIPYLLELLKKGEGN